MEKRNDLLEKALVELHLENMSLKNKLKEKENSLTFWYKRVDELESKLELKDEIKLNNN